MPYDTFNPSPPVQEFRELLGDKVVLPGPELTRPRRDSSRYQPAHMLTPARAS